MRYIKKASMPVYEIIGLILAAACLAIILLLIMQSLFPINHDKETAKSFLNSLKQSLNEANTYGRSEFRMWGDNIALKKEKEKFFILYFGKDHIFDYSEARYLFIFGKRTFIPIPNRNTLFKASHSYNRAICSCYRTTNTVKYNNKDYFVGTCPYCTNFPGEISKAVLNGVVSSPSWITITLGENITIEKKTTGYEITK